jgi:hypothetical protein
MSDYDFCLAVSKFLKPSVAEGQEKLLFLVKKYSKLQQTSACGIVFHL